MDKRKRRVIADGAYIAEMIGEALKLNHQRAEPNSARRNLQSERSLDSPCKGERVGDGAVARGAAGKTCALLKARASHQRLDSLMHIAEPLFEPHHRLTIGGEAKMPWLDDAGMDG